MERTDSSRRHHDTAEHTLASVPHMLQALQGSDLQGRLFTVMLVQRLTWLCVALTPLLYALHALHALHALQKS